MTSEECIVYGLEDPRDHLYHYIGITNDVYRRFNEHVTGSSGNIEKNGWIFECRQSKIMIVMHEIERLTSSENAAQREKFWIDYYLRLGHPLHNSAITRTLSGKQTVLETEKQIYEKTHVQQDESFLIISEGSRVIAMSRLRLEEERNSSPFHMFPVMVGLTAAFMCMGGIAVSSLAIGIALGLTWLIVAGFGAAYCAAVLAFFQWFYVYSLGLTSKQEHTQDKKGDK